MTTASVRAARTPQIPNYLTNASTAFKPNSTNILVSNLFCNGSHGVSVGSLGQVSRRYAGYMRVGSLTLCCAVRGRDGHRRQRHGVQRVDEQRAEWRAHQGVRREPEPQYVRAYILTFRRTLMCVQSSEHGWGRYGICQECHLRELRRCAPRGCRICTATVLICGDSQECGQPSHH